MTVAVNSQYSEPLFGYGASWDSTGAPGTPGESAHPPMADTAFTTAATGAFESVQNRPAAEYSVGVGRDDTAPGGVVWEDFSGQGPGAMASTGAGQGSVSTPHHPNAMGPR